MEFHGAVLSLTLGYVMMPLLLVPYFICQPNGSIWWPGWNTHAAWGYVPLFLKLGVPGLSKLAMEWWAYETMTIIAGVLMMWCFSAHILCS